MCQEHTVTIPNRKNDRKKQEKSGEGCARAKMTTSAVTSPKYYIVHINQIFSIQTEVTGALVFFAAHHGSLVETVEEAQRKTPHASVIDHTN